jgi:hypothetical protein
MAYFYRIVSCFYTEIKLCAMSLFFPLTISYRRVPKTSRLLYSQRTFSINFTQRVPCGRFASFRLATALLLGGSFAALTSSIYADAPDGDDIPTNSNLHAERVSRYLDAYFYKMGGHTTYNTDVTRISSFLGPAYVYWPYFSYFLA